MIAIVVGWAAGRVLETFGGTIAVIHLLSILASMVITLGVILVLKNTSIAEIRRANKTLSYRDIIDW